MAEAPRVTHCCAVVPDESGGVMTVTGGSNGTVYLWSGLDCIRSIPAAHDAMPVRSVAWANVKCGTPGSSTASVIDVVTGGEDGKVRCWAVIPGKGAGRRPNMLEVVAVSAPPVDPAEALAAAASAESGRRRPDSSPARRPSPSQYLAAFLDARRGRDHRLRTRCAEESRAARGEYSSTGRG